MSQIRSVAIGSSPIRYSRNCRQTMNATSTEVGPPIPVIPSSVSISMNTDDDRHAPVVGRPHFLALAGPVFGIDVDRLDQPLFPELPFERQGARKPGAGEHR